MINCPNVREVADVVEKIGTMVGPEGYLRSTAPRNNFCRTCSKIVGSPKSLVERWVDYKIFALPVLGYIGSLTAQNKRPSQRNLAPCNDSQRDHTAPSLPKC